MSVTDRGFLLELGKLIPICIRRSNLAKMAMKKYNRGEIMTQLN